MKEQQSNSFLATRPIGKLMRSYCIPCVISLLVAALYNIVDQIFIANADYLGSLGNAANTVVFPLTVIALAIAVMIGDGCCAFVSIRLGAGDREKAHKSVGNAVILCIISGLVLAALYLGFSGPILTAFGGRVNEETFRLSKEYFFWITLGIPFYIFGQALNPVIRSDGSPKFAMLSTLAGAPFAALFRTGRRSVFHAGGRYHNICGITGYHNIYLSRLSATNTLSARINTALAPKNGL